MAIANGADYNHIDVTPAAGGDAVRHMLQDAQGRALIANLNKDKAPVIVDTAAGTPASFPDAIGGVAFINVTAEITPVQTVASNTPNIWNEEWESGKWNDDYGTKGIHAKCIRCKAPVPVTPGGSYYIKAPADLAIRELAEEGGPVIAYGNRVRDAIYTVTANTRFIVFFTRADDEITTYGNDISVNFPATETSYYPYQEIHPITGGRTMWSLTVAPNPDGTGGSMIGGFFPMVQFEQVTVYGGALNMTTGELSSTHGFVEDLGDLEWTYDAEGGYFTSTGVAATAKANSDKGFCSILPVGSTLTGDRIYVGADGAIIAYYADASTAAEFAQAMDGQQFVYELAQGTTYNLTPTEITALAGQNYVWAGTGDVTVQYRADTKRYVDKKIAELAALILENI